MRNTQETFSKDIALSKHTEQILVLLPKEITQKTWQYIRKNFMTLSLLNETHGRGVKFQTQKISCID